MMRDLYAQVFTTGCSECTRCNETCRAIILLANNIYRLNGRTSKGLDGNTVLARGNLFYQVEPLFRKLIGSELNDRAIMEWSIEESSC